MHKINYTRPAKIDYTRPDRTPAPIFSNGVRVLQKGETVVIATIR